MTSSVMRRGEGSLETVEWNEAWAEALREKLRGREGYIIQDQHGLRLLDWVDGGGRVPISPGHQAGDHRLKKSRRSGHVVKGFPYEPSWVRKKRRDMQLECDHAACANRTRSSWWL